MNCAPKFIILVSAIHFRLSSFPSACMSRLCPNETLRVFELCTPTTTSDERIEGEAGGLGDDIFSITLFALVCTNPFFHQRACFHTFDIDISKRNVSEDSLVFHFVDEHVGHFGGDGSIQRAGVAHLKAIARSVVRKYPLPPVLYAADKRQSLVVQHSSITIK